MKDAQPLYNFGGCDVRAYARYVANGRRCQKYIRNLNVQIDFKFRIIYSTEIPETTQNHNSEPVGTTVLIARQQLIYSKNLLLKRAKQ